MTAINYAEQKLFVLLLQSAMKGNKKWSNCDKLCNKLPFEDIMDVT